MSRGAQTFSVREYVDEHGYSPYLSWLMKLDLKTRTRIRARVFRFEMGNLGDIRSVGWNVWEAKLNFGPGYRVYFGFRDKDLILLLLGGNKGSQARDILKARTYFKNYLGDQK